MHRYSRTILASTIRRSLEPAMPRRSGPPDRWMLLQQGKGRGSGFSSPSGDVWTMLERGRLPHFPMGDGGVGANVPPPEEERTPPQRRLVLVVVVGGGERTGRDDHIILEGGQGTAALTRRQGRFYDGHY